MGIGMGEDQARAAGFVAYKTAREAERLGLDVPSVVASALNDVDPTGKLKQAFEFDDQILIPAPRTAKAILPKGVGPKSGYDTGGMLDEIEAKHPNPFASAETWQSFLEDVQGTIKGRNIPNTPNQLVRYANDADFVTKDLEGISPSQRDLTNKGLAAARVARDSYDKGAVSPQQSAEYLLWGILSRRASPKPHETAFLLMEKGGVGQFIDDAFKGKFNLNNYLTWVKQTLSGTEGAGATSNANSFGKTFLAKVNQKVAGGPLKGRTLGEAWHEVMANPGSAKETRRVFQSLGISVGIDNKVLDLLGLITGKTDGIPFDRVRFNDAFPQRSVGGQSGVLPYSQAEIQGLGSGLPGAAFYEGVERSLSPNVARAYRDLIVKQFPGMGRWHWETWVKRSDQEVSHVSQNIILDRNAIGSKSAVPEGRYEDRLFGATAFVDVDGKIRHGIPLANGKHAILDQKALNEFKQAIDEEVVPKGFKRTQHTDSPWIDNPAVDRRAYDAAATRLAADVSARTPSLSGQDSVRRLFQSGKQGLKGLYDRVTNEITLIKGNADISSIIHENGHALKEILLQGENSDLIRKLYGDSADVKGHERFARHLENYFRTGKAPDSKMAQLFESIKGWMRDIYTKWSGGSANAEVKAIFDRVYGTSDARTDAFLKAFDEEFKAKSLAEVSAKAPDSKKAPAPVEPPTIPIPKRPVKKVEAAGEPAPNVSQNQPREGVSAEGNRFTEERMNPNDILVKEGMQFKRHGITDKENAVTDQLKGASVYDQAAPSISVWEAKDGKRYVIDGHHRRELAIRAEAKDVPVHVYRESDGVSFNDARDLGVLKNLKDGKGTPLDIAVALSNLKYTPEGLKKVGVSNRSTLARQGSALASLHPDALKFVADGKVSEEVGAGIGSVEMDRVRQIAAMNEAKNKPGIIKTESEARRLAERISKMPEKARSGNDQGSMFDDVLDPELAIAETAKLEDSVVRSLLQDKRLSEAILKGRAHGETVVDSDAQANAARISEFAHKALGTDREAAQALEDAAHEYAQNPTNEALAKARAKVLPIARAAAERKLAELFPQRGQNSGRESLDVPALVPGEVAPTSLLDVAPEKPKAEDLKLSADQPKPKKKEANPVGKQISMTELGAEADGQPALTESASQTPKEQAKKKVKIEEDNTAPVGKGVWASSLTDKQRWDTLETLNDSYRGDNDLGQEAEQVEKVKKNGNTYLAYLPNQRSHMVRSDHTGSLVRHFILTPYGRAHVSEVFPGLSEKVLADLDAALQVGDVDGMAKKAGYKDAARILDIRAARTFEKNLEGAVATYARKTKTPGRPNFIKVNQRTPSLVLKALRASDEWVLKGAPKVDLNGVPPSWDFMAAHPEWVQDSLKAIKDGESYSGSVRERLMAFDRLAEKSKSTPAPAKRATVSESSSSFDPTLSKGDKVIVRNPLNGLEQTFEYRGGNKADMSLVWDGKKESYFPTEWIQREEKPTTPKKQAKANLEQSGKKVKTASDNASRRARGRQAGSFVPLDPEFMAALIDHAKNWVAYGKASAKEWLDHLRKEGGDEYADEVAPHLNKIWAKAGGKVDEPVAETPTQEAKPNAPKKQPTGPVEPVADSVNTLYHGTTSAFEGFDSSKSRRGGLTWFTPDQEFANRFADIHSPRSIGESPRIIKYNQRDGVKILSGNDKGFIDHAIKNWPWAESPDEPGVLILDSKFAHDQFDPNHFDDLFDALTPNELKALGKEGDFRIAESPEFVKYAKVNGYEGVSAIENGHKTIGLFDPSKSGEVAVNRTETSSPTQKAKPTPLTGTTESVVTGDKLKAGEATTPKKRVRASETETGSQVTGPRHSLNNEPRQPGLSKQGAKTIGEEAYAKLGAKGTMDAVNRSNSENGHILSEEEMGAATEHKNVLKNTKVRDINSPEAKRISADIAAIDLAQKRVGNEKFHRAGIMHQVMVNESGALVDSTSALEFVGKMEAKADRPLTDTERTKYAQMYSELETLRAAHDKAITEHQETQRKLAESEKKRAEAIAEAQVDQIRRGQATRSEGRQANQADIRIRKKEVAKDLVKTFSGRLSANIDPTVLADMAPGVVELVKLHAKDVGLSVAEIADRVASDINASLAEAGKKSRIKPQDIIDVLGGKYKQTPETRAKSELQRLREESRRLLRSQTGEKDAVARELESLEAQLQKIGPKKPKTGKTLTDPEAVRLKEKIRAIKTKLVQDAADRKAAFNAMTARDRVQKRIDNLQARLDFVGPKKPKTANVLDDPKVFDLKNKLNAAKAKASREADKIEADAKFEKLSPAGKALVKTGKGLLKLQRFMILGGLNVFGKIGSATVGGAALAPFEELLGPLVGGVSRKYGGTEHMLVGKAEVDAMKALLSGSNYKDVLHKIYTKYNVMDEGSIARGEKVPYGNSTPSWEDIVNTLRTKSPKSKLDAAKMVPSAVLDTPGSGHGGVKTLLQHSAYARELAKQIIRAEKLGMDINSPATQDAIHSAAYARSQIAIFQNENALTNMWKSALSKAGAAEGVIKTFTPIVKTPTNVVGALLDRTFGLLYGGVKHAAYSTVFRDKMTPEIADSITRSYKHGGVGAALVAAGWLLPQLFGGYYDGKKRENGELQPNEVMITPFGKNIVLPHWATHNMLFMLPQIGATMRHAMDANAAKSGGRGMNSLLAKRKETNPVGKGLLDVFNGVLEQVPIINEAGNILEASTNADKANQFIKAYLSSFFTPQIVKEYAKGRDNVKRDPQSLVDYFKMDWPGLRETVKPKTPKSSGGLGSLGGLGNL